MGIKSKLALTSIVGILGISIVGAGTFAIFNSQVSNNSNTYTAGKIVLDSNRNDVPIVGPMFYTNFNPGQHTGGGLLATGFWKPGDIHTRGMFIKNSGNIDAKLSSLVALPQNSSGQIVTPSSNGSDKTAFDNDSKFAKQGMVTIQVWQRASGSGLDGILTAANYNAWLQSVNSDYQDALERAELTTGFKQAWWTAIWYAEQLKAASAAGMMDASVYNLYDDFDPIQPVQVWSGTLAELMSDQSPTGALANITLGAGKTMFMTYTVTLPDLGLANNEINGLGDTFFGFKSEFKQLKHNT